MNKFHLQIIINGKDILKKNNVLNAVVDTIKSIEDQSNDWRNKYLFNLILPDEKITRLIGELYSTILPKSCTIIFTNDCQSELCNCIKKSKATYVAVVNAGDVFSSGAFKKIYDYFESAKGNIDIVGLKLNGKSSANDLYNTNFTSSAPRNLHFLTSYTKPPCSINGLFIKTNVAKEKAALQTKGFNEENFLVDVLIRRKTMGLMEPSVNIKTNEEEPEMVTADAFEKKLNELYNKLVKVAEQESFIPYFIQNIAVHIIMNMYNNSQDIMGEYQHKDYDFSDMWFKFSKTMKYIDDKVILDFSTTRYNKLFLLKEKYGRFCDYDVKFNDLQMFYANTATYAVSSLHTRIQLMSIEDGKLVIEGINLIPSCINMNEFSIAAVINGKLTEIEQVERYSDGWFFDKPYTLRKGFKLELPLIEGRYEIKIANKIGANICIKEKYEFMEICSLDSKIKEGYYFKNGYVVTFNQNSFVCEACSEERRIELEEQLKEKIILSEPERADEIIEIRDFYWENHNKKDKQIWLVTDRPDRGDDNGEAFFNYVASLNAPDIDLYFILTKSSSDYDRISKIGKVIEPFSQEHKKLHVLADYIISSQMTQAVYTPFNEDIIYFRDLFRNAKHIFLQHGITDKNQGNTMGKYGRDFYGLITSVEKEYNYFINESKFCYSNKEIWLTGFPRFDYLYRNDAKKITIMPTWRKYLTKRTYDKEANTTIWRVNDNFTDSEYFKFYNGLINSQELLDAADEYGYKICFMPHPIFLRKVGEFEHNERAIIYEYEKNYKEIYAESSLVVTDYSSAAFDFAYMRQPVLYCQFDKDFFWSNHVYKKGFFDHEKDGFGEVAYDLETTIKLLIEYMSNGCVLKEKYQKRIDDFFAYRDNKNSERVYNKIKTLERENTSKTNENAEASALSEENKKESLELCSPSYGG